MLLTGCLEEATERANRRVAVGPCRAGRGPDHRTRPDVPSPGLVKGSRLLFSFLRRRPLMRWRQRRSSP